MRAAFVIGLAVSSAAFGQTFDWNDAAGGDWFDQTNWSPVGVPNTFGESASIALGGSYLVSLNTSVDLDAFELLNQFATVDVLNGVTLEADSLTVDGTFRVNPLQGNSTTTLEALGTGAITGIGAVELFSRADQASPNGRILAGSAGLTVAAGIEVRGSGSITSGSFSRTLTLDGVVRALPGFGAADLEISSRYSTLELTGGGELIADAWGLTYEGGTIRGGTLREVNGGAIGFDGSVTFDDVAFDLPRALDVPSGATFRLINGTEAPTGAVRVNPQQGTSTTRLQFDDAVTPLPGLVELFSRGDQATPNGQVLAGVSTLAVPGGSEIRGSGLINATGFSRTLVLDGVVRASPGFGAADLVVSDRYSTVDMTGGGELIADAWGLTFEGGTLRGGALREINGGAVTFVGSAVFDGVLLDLAGPLGVPNGATFRLIGGTLAPTGTVRVNPQQGNSTTQLRFEDTITPVPPVVELFSRPDEPTPNAQLFTTLSTLAVPPGVEIRGSGLINASGFGRTLELAGVLRAAPGFGAADMVISSRYTTVDLTGGGELVADAWGLTHQGGTIRGGTIRETNGGTVTFVGSMVFDGVTLDLIGPLVVPNSTTYELIGGTRAPLETVLVNPEQGASTTALEVSDSTPLPDLVELFSRSDENSANAQVLTSLASLTIPAGAEIRGSGLVNATGFGRTLINNGTLRDVESNGASPLVVSSRFGDYVQDAGATLVAIVEPGVDGDAGDRRTTRIESDNPQLDGTLRVELASGYTPEFGDIAEIFLSRGTGEFSALDLPVLTEPLVSRVRYVDSGVFYVVSCRADVDGDGLIDFFDVVSYLASFDAGEPSADLAAPFGTFDFFDVVTFLGQFDAGC
ncbi:MAG: GC-type dockerin domain-anchored protein [Planctomycetota bacterium]